MASCAARGPLLHSERTELAVGESIRLTANNLKAPLTFYTTDEHRAVVERNGTVTAIAFEPQHDSVTIAASSGATRMTYGSASLDLKIRPGGKLPSLVMTTNRDKPGASEFACCPNSAVVQQGSTLRFHILRVSLDREDITGKGTKYVRFFGSGIPDDPNPRRIIGQMYSGLSAKNFTIDDAGGEIHVPMITPDNRRNIVIFFRNGRDIGWKGVTIKR